MTYLVYVGPFMSVRTMEYMASDLLYKNKKYSVVVQDGGGRHRKRFWCPGGVAFAFGQDTPDFWVDGWIHFFAFVDFAYYGMSSRCRSISARAI
jgi:hypothetical protein